MARVPISQKDSCVDQLEHLSRIPRDAGLALLGEVRQLLAATHPQTADTPHGASYARVACRSPAVACADKVIVMAKSMNRKRRSAVSPAPDPSSLRSAALDRSANVTEYGIARRAYELYLARDCADGHDVDDWLQAERELRRGASMNRDELEGKAEALKGKIKQAAGTLTRDPDLHDEGVIDEVAGKTQAAVGRTKRKVGEAIEHVGNVIKK